MYKKGKILEIHNNYSIVLTDGCEFIKIENKNQMEVGKSVLFTENEIYTSAEFVEVAPIKNFISSFNFKQYSMIAIAASLIFMMVLVGYQQFGQSNELDMTMPFSASEQLAVVSSSYAVVSIDINPSVELFVDEDLIITTYEALNDDGLNVIDESLIGMPLEEGLDYIVSNAEEHAYLTDEKDSVLIATAVLMDDEQLTAVEINDVLADSTLETHQELNIITVASTKEKHQSSSQKNKSLGKHEIAITITDVNEAEGVQDATIDELFEQGLLENENFNIHSNKYKTKHQESPDDKDNGIGNDDKQFDSDADKNKGIGNDEKIDVDKDKDNNDNGTDNNDKDKGNSDNITGKTDKDKGNSNHPDNNDKDKGNSDNITGKADKDKSNSNHPDNKDKGNNDALPKNNVTEDKNIDNGSDVDVIEDNGKDNNGGRDNKSEKGK